MDWMWLLLLPVGYLLFIVLNQQATTQHKEIRARLERQETQLRRIAEHLGIPPDESHLAAVQDQLRSGRKIAAIKAYRDATGVGLADAKRAVERIEQGLPPT